MTNKPSFIPYSGLNIKENEGFELSKVQYNKASLRRSVRDFSDKPVSFETVKNIIMTAATAPSGAHKQPWTFCLVSNPEIKMKIREAAEKEEYESYNNRMSEKWLKDLEPIGISHF
jgi:iodotyrosine deiodinase